MMGRERIVALLAILAAGAFVLALRLFAMQVVNADEWRSEGDALGARFTTIPFRRGAILDRLGRPIAVDEDSFALDFEYAAFRSRHPLGQAASVRSILEGRIVSHSEIAANPEGTAVSIGAVTPAQIANVWIRSERSAARVALAALLRLDRAQGRQLAAQVADRSNRPISELYASKIAELPARLAAGRDDLARLDALLDRAAGTTLGEIDARRLRILQDVEVRISRLRERGGSGALDPEDTAEERVQRRRQREVWLERFMSDVSYEAAELVAARPDRLPGFSVSESMTRRYREPILPRFVGTVARPADDELAEAEQSRQRVEELARLLSPTEEQQQELTDLRRKLREEQYTPGDVSGKSGIEFQYEDVLRGTRGWKIELVSRRGGEAERVQSKAPENGRDVTLTLDLELQEACERVLRSGLPTLPGQPIRGAITLVDVATGDVLAAAAQPSYTRDDLKDPARWDAVRRVDEDPRSRAKPLSHRAFHPYYPPAPGSVFKVVTAIAALERGIVDPSTKHLCGGVIGTLKCEGHHGEIDLRTAMEVSCNVYFGWLGERLGRTALQDSARRFGFGSPTGFSPIEVPGSLELQSEDLELLRRFGIGYTLTVTPLQVARLYGAIASDGRLRPLRSVRSVGSFELPLREGVDLHISSENLSILRESLRAVVHRGTARDSGLFELGAAGKTGTAEVDAKGVDNHAWFAGYAPFDAPRVAFAMYVERVPIHGKDITPMARALLSSGALRPYLRP
ncbi:MAG: hypothetical protein JNJ88_06490 [Planctomycetes bacterium]|nr:hypothetical protein [Planctomycetota bacterium]